MRFYYNLQANLYSCLTLGRGRFIPNPFQLIILCTYTVRHYVPWGTIQYFDSRQNIISSGSFWNWPRILEFTDDGSNIYARSSCCYYGYFFLIWPFHFDNCPLYCRLMNGVVQCTWRCQLVPTGSCIHGGVFYVTFISEILHSFLRLSDVSAWSHTVHTIPTGARQYSACCGYPQICGFT